MNDLTPFVLRRLAQLILLPNDQILGISSSHLAPFKSNASLRLQQTMRLYEALSSVNPNFVMAGDFNMRVAEDDQVEQLGLRDVYKESKRPRDAMYTWNSIDNRYHGPDAFGFKCRFDRIYFSFGSSQPKLSLVGDQPHVVMCGSSEYKFYLSDHYGMLCTFQLPTP